MTPEDRSLLAELTICLVTLTEAAARIGLDMRQEGAGIIGDACDRLGIVERPLWVARPATGEKP